MRPVAQLVRQGSKQPPAPATRPRLLSGKVSGNKPAPVSYSDPVYVVMANHSPDVSIPCAWAPINGTTVPAAGNAVLVAYDDNGLPRVVWWDGVPEFGGAFSVAVESGSVIAASGQEIHMTAAGTVTTPAAALGARVRAYNDTGSPAAAVSLAAATGVIMGKGIPAAGTTAIPLNVNGAFAEAVCDGTNWKIIGGEQDTGHVAPTGWQDGWTSSGGLPATYRLRGSTFAMYGEAVPGSSSTFLTLPTGLAIPKSALFPCVIGGTGALGNIEVDDTSGGLTASQFANPVFLNTIRYEID